MKRNNIVMYFSTYARKKIEKSQQKKMRRKFL